MNTTSCKKPSQKGNIFAPKTKLMHCRRREEDRIPGQKVRKEFLILFPEGFLQCSTRGLWALSYSWVFFCKQTPVCTSLLNVTQ